jgi:NDP-4-keto-2,6-dideoxyhexose 3-C-methyltransferase
VREWSECRLCGNDKLESVADLGVQAISCRYPKSRDEKVPTAPLHLVRCPSCNLGQLTMSLPPEEMYRSGYSYRSGQTDTMKAHLRELAHEGFSRGSRPPAMSTVVDIGSNDGTFLSMIPDRCRRIGFDPVSMDHDYPDGVVKVVQRFSAAAFHEWYPDEKADLVFATAMFYDLDDPVGFLKEVASILADDGLLVMEFMYLKAMLDGAWDQISHEHVCYHSLGTVKRAANMAGLDIADFSDQTINGGTLRVFLCHGVDPKRYPGQDARLEEEDSWDWSVIPERIMMCREGTWEFRTRCFREDQTIDILGASQRGNVVLQAMLPFPDGTRAIERDERKDGTFTPGTRIPIIHESKRDGFADAYIVTPWQFADEIIAREKQLGAPPGTKYLLPLPTPRVITIGEDE